MKGLAPHLKNDIYKTAKGSRSLSAGFTMIEVLVVLTIFGALMLMGLFFDLSFYRGTSFATDVDAFASVLQRARARAVNNINGSAHGVYIDTDSYILFQGSTYAGSTNHEPISKNPGLNFSGASEVVFTQLSGGSNFEGDIIISGFGKTATISLNYEGLINR